MYIVKELASWRCKMVVASTAEEAAEKGLDLGLANPVTVFAVGNCIIPAYAGDNN